MNKEELKNWFKRIDSDIDFVNLLTNPLHKIRLWNIRLTNKNNPRFYLTAELRKRIIR